MTIAEGDKEWFVYMARCSDRSLYTGIAVDVDRRIDEHNHDNKKAAKYTRARRPIVLVYKEPCEDQSSAQQREAAIKRLSKAEKEQLLHESGITND